MSDPVTNVQIEDVLSSIRRLVSEESRLETRVKPAPPDKSSDRLVLTPALRVATETEAEVEAEAKDDSDTPEPPAVEPTSDITDTLTLSNPIEPSDELDQPQIEAEQAEEEPDFEAAADEETSLEDTEAAETGADDAPWADPEATLYDAAQAASDTAEAEDAEIDTSDASGEDSVERDASDDTDDDDAFDDTDDADTAPETADWDGVEDADVVYDQGPEAADQPAEDIDHGEDIAVQPVYEDIDPVIEAAETAADDNQPEIAEDDAVAPGVLSHSARAESLSAKIEALEAAIGKTKDQWEPDGAIGDDYAGTATVTPMAWRDSDSADTVDSQPSLGDIDEAVLDEESLRELVSDIVREELQGALGERITRNVRKLVRREIHRALAAQELD